MGATAGKHVIEETETHRCLWKYPERSTCILKCEQVLRNELISCRRKRTLRFLFGKVRGFKSRNKVDVEVEAKGTSDNTGRHLELGPLGKEASVPYVHPKNLGGYYRVHGERGLIGCKKHDTPQFPVSLSRSHSWRERRTW